MYKNESNRVVMQIEEKNVIEKTMIIYSILIVYKLAIDILLNKYG